jgi:hypothetical protein
MIYMKNRNRKIAVFLFGACSTWPLISNPITNRADFFVNFVISFYTQHENRNSMLPHLWR